MERTFLQQPCCNLTGQIKKYGGVLDAMIFQEDASSLNIGQLTSTKMYCDGAMKNEYAIQRVLKDVGSFDISNGTLTLYSLIEKKPLLTALKNKQ
jgi:hypothetical protein